MSISLTVYGTPVPQGSARAFAIPGKDGARPRAVVVSDNKKSLAHWRTQIGNEARQVIRAGDVTGEPPPDFNGPIAVDVIFTFNRPRSVSKKERPYPSVKPDIDKLGRAVLDALTGILFKDDAQVVGLHLAKRYNAEPGPDFAMITVRGME